VRIEIKVLSDTEVAEDLKALGAAIRDH
jgi:hypothetical protein